MTPKCTRSTLARNVCCAGEGAGGDSGKAARQQLRAWRSPWSDPVRTPCNPRPARRACRGGRRRSRPGGRSPTRPRPACRTAPALRAPRRGRCNRLTPDQKPGSWTNAVSAKPSSAGARPADHAERAARTRRRDRSGSAPTDSRAAGCRTSRTRYRLNRSRSWPPITAASTRATTRGDSAMRARERRAVALVVGVRRRGSRPNPAAPHGRQPARREPTHQQRRLPAAALASRARARSAVRVLVGRDDERRRGRLAARRARCSPSRTRRAARAARSAAAAATPRPAPAAAGCSRSYCSRPLDERAIVVRRGDAERAPGELPARAARATAPRTPAGRSCRRRSR